MLRMSAEAEAVEHECYGTADDLTRERYGIAKRRPPTRPARTDAAALLAAGPPPSRTGNGWRVTTHARVLHDCGRYVYTEAVGRRPAAFPAVCWYCGTGVAV